MLDSTTKRRIDACRDILVGKVPDPKSQVEQITIALIYKFMDDMDAEAEELGGKRSFFAGEYGKYGWARLMAPNQGGFEVLALYSEAIGKMNENPGIPALFRDIFKNAYLPYRDPETLRAFLKEIDGFTYDHSERLGDAFEYLLSVLGSQGDAGQFRTPRHIIDFMVEIIDPKKNESVLDPACGTAGFLISAWKHILRQNTRERAGDLLTPDERANLAANIHGYDISPDMVRLSLVNMYLHGFTDPHIVEYDTLTSEERWNETADVILANPPFMSPKGGIRPHKRFSVQSNRSEVLFVDYMVEHLNPNGRAAIVVPEGVIFQNGNAYRKLRELLVKESLVGVISLPSGVFQPYSGVKTSILVLDKHAAKSNRKVLFSEVRHIGVSLGVKRTITEHNDLPNVLRDYRAYYLDGQLSSTSWTATRDEILANECVLTGSQYLNRPVPVGGEARPVRLFDICTISKGAFSSTKTPAGDYPLIVTAEDQLTASDFQFDGDAVCVPLISSTGHGRASIKRIHFATGKFALANLLAALQPISNEEVSARFLYFLLDSRKADLAALMKGAANVGMKVEDLAGFQIPLPPLAIQHEIVVEIEGYQKIIDGARQVVENYRPRIDVQPDWPVSELGALCDVKSGGTPDRSEPSYWNGTIPWVKTGQIDFGRIDAAEEFITEAGMANSSTRMIPAGTILMAMYGQGITRGKVAILGINATINQACAAILPKANAAVDRDYLFHVLASKYQELRAISDARGGNQSNLNAQLIRDTKIPLPDIETQRAIVAEIQAEQALVDANKQLIARFEAKIKATIDRVWGGSA
jgi:type I restriction enzyme M protein